MNAPIIAPLLAASFGLVADGEGAARPGLQPAWLVEFDALQACLADSNLRVIDVRTDEDYKRGHIPGAVRVDTKALKEMAAKPGALTDRALWEKWIAPLGIGPKTEVVIYDANRQLDAARLWWLLSYLGVERVGLLNGNYPLWAAEQRPETTDAPTVEPLPFKVAFRAARHAKRGALHPGLDGIDHR